MRCAAFFFFGGGPGLLELLCEVVDEDAADDVEGEAARGVDAGDGDVVVLVAEDGGVGDARAERGGVPVAGWNIYGEYFALGGGSIVSISLAVMQRMSLLKMMLARASGASALATCSQPIRTSNSPITS